MDYSAEAEQALRGLVADARERAAKAQREAETFQQALDAYLAMFNRAPAPMASKPAPEIVRRLADASYRQMLRIWADDHDGRIVVRELVDAAVETGRFESRTKAHRTLWSATSQAAKKREIERIDEGVYQVRPTPLTDEQRAERIAESEAFVAAHNLPLPNASSPVIYTEPDMPPARQTA